VSASYEHAVPSPRSPNKLLARLPADEYQRLLPDLDTVRLRPHRVLLKPHVPLERIYFPGGGVCSMTQVTSDGQVAGVALIGSEGFIGVSAVGDGETGQTAAVEIADSDYQVMDTRAFRREMQHHTVFHDLVHQYAQVFIESLMQSVVCNALHPVEKRCARCLLDIRDRVGRNAFPLTQDVLAAILGVRRASVTLAAGALHRAGLIDTAHKNIVIRDPARLEAAACECYGLIKAHFARLLR
jgi:CRP-like cAMP-binding protein